MLCLILQGQGSPIGVYDIVVLAINFIRVIMIPYLAIYGWVLMCNYHMQQVYGQGLGCFGFFFFIVSLVDTATIIAYMYGQKKHNKFALGLQALVDTITWLMMISLLAGLKQRITPKYTWELQNLCLSYERKSPVLYDPMCKEYFNSDRYAGVTIAYRAWYSRYKRGNVKYYKKLSQVGRNYACCGLGRVGSCEENKKKLPFYYPKWYLESEYKKQKQLCYEESALSSPTGVDTYYYKETENCNVIRNLDEYPWVYLGCPYELPVGACQKRDPEPTTKGCAAGLEQTFQNYFKPNISLITFYDVIKLFSIIVSLLKFFERKINEVHGKVYITPDPPPYAILTILQPQEEEESKIPDNFDKMNETEKAKILEKIYKSKEESMNPDDEGAANE